MLGSGRPDGTTARARLRSITPRWVPTEADLVSAAAGPADPPSSPAPPAAAGVADEPRQRSARHNLPDRPPPTWRLSADAARGLASLALAALVGALTVVVIGWPRGEAAPDATTPQHEANARANAGADAGALSVLEPPASSPEVVVVDVDGAVRRPGVVELPGGSRVVDALDAAGGVQPRADTGALNLAQVLLDGEQVVVPGARAGGATDPAAVASPAPGGVPTSGLVSINTATEAELDTLPGIGPVLAAAIVEWRTQNNGFTSVDQLQDVSGIGPATFAELAPLVRL